MVVARSVSQSVSSKIHLGTLCTLLLRAQTVLKISRGGIFPQLLYNTYGIRILLHVEVRNRVEGGTSKLASRLSKMGCFVFFLGALPSTAP